LPGNFILLDQQLQAGQVARHPIVVRQSFPHARDGRIDPACGDVDLLPGGVGVCPGGLQARLTKERRGGSRRSSTAGGIDAISATVSRCSTASRAIRVRGARHKPMELRPLSWSKW